MPATEIPPKRPLPPAPPQIAGTDLYDAARWESVYREMHNVPELLLQLQDDLSRSRKREAFWISVVTHLVLIILVVNSPKFAKYFPQSRVVIALPRDNQRELTYLEQPPDSQKVPKKPNTNIISDKDRMATSRTPQLDRDELHKILDSARPGAPGLNTPPAGQPQQPQAEAQPQAPPQQAQTQPQPDDNQNAALRTPQQATPPKPSFGAGSMSAGSAIEQAARAAIARGPYVGGDGGDYGLGRGRQAAKALGNLDVLSDTMGVDFGPYLQRVLHDVKVNWYTLIPESARPPLMKKGKVSIEFAIMKNGTVQGMTLSGPSGDVSLDRAAWGGITNSAPFPTLPADFRGDYLLLRFNFYYNPDGSDLD